MKLIDLGKLEIGDKIKVESSEFLISYIGMEGIVVYNCGESILIGLCHNEHYIKYNDTIPYSTKLIKG